MPATSLQLKSHTYVSDDIPLSCCSDAWLLSDLADEALTSPDEVIELLKTCWDWGPPSVKQNMSYYLNVSYQDLAAIPRRYYITQVNPAVRIGVFTCTCCLWKLLKTQSRTTKFYSTAETNAQTRFKKIASSNTLWFFCKKSKAQLWSVVHQDMILIQTWGLEICVLLLRGGAWRGGVVYWWCHRRSGRYGSSQPRIPVINRDWWLCGYRESTWNKNNVIKLYKLVKSSLIALTGPF